MIGQVGAGGVDMMQAWRARIAAADTDSSGGLSLNEFNNLASASQTASAGSTGSTSTASATNVSQLFAKLDTNGDGQLTADELTPRHHHHGGQGGGINGPAPSQLGNSAMSVLIGLQSGGASSTVSGIASSLIGASDTDGDGALTPSEFASSASSSQSSDAAKAFAAADANGDGQLTADELAQALQKALDQQMQAGGQRAYDQLLASLSAAANSATSAPNPAGIAVSA